MTYQDIETLEAVADSLYAVYLTVSNDALDNPRDSRLQALMESLREATNNIYFQIRELS